MESGIYYTYGESTPETNEIILCSAGFQLDGKDAFCVMNDSKATATIYFSRASFEARVNSGMIKPKYKKGQGSPAK